jgi:hypothetical protein
MNSPIFLTRTHLEQALTPEQLRPTIIIRIALMLGIVFFYLAVFLVYSLHSSNRYDQIDSSSLDFLSLGHAVFACAMTIAAFVLSKSSLQKERLALDPSPKTSEEAASRAVNLHRVSSIFLMAPLEGAAFLGAAICFIGVESGIMDVNPMYWLNALSAGVMIGIGLITFPTRERIITTLESIFVNQ